MEDMQKKHERILGRALKGDGGVEFFLCSSMGGGENHVVIFGRRWGMKIDRRKRM